MAIEITQRPECSPQTMDLPGRRAVEPAIVVFGMFQEGNNQFVDGEVECGIASIAYAPATCFPLAQHAGIFGPAFGSAVFAQEEVFATPETIRQGNNGVATLLVKAIGRNL